MRLLALVPARGGSQRVPNKNIRELGGKPLIQWTLDVAAGIQEIVDVLVSTDSIEIAKMAKEAGAMVPWLRPVELATHTATTIDVCMHALEWYEKEKNDIDGIILLQPTSPFREKENIQKAIELFKKNRKSSVVSFSKAQTHPMWCYKIDNGRVDPFINDVDLNIRSQDLPDAYMINGSIYISSVEALRKERTFITANTIALVIDGQRASLDIDTEDDWKIAEMIVRNE